MQALRFQSPGDPLEVLSCSEVEVPQPGTGQVRLRMRLATINPSDLLQVRGLYGRKAELPATAGLEGLGVVDALGPGVGGIERGQRVVPLTAQGTWADYLVVPAETLVSVPDRLADESAAQITVNPLTAWILAQELHLGPGDWLIQSAAGSSVGRCLIQLSKRRGYKTVNLVRRRDQVEELLSEGADAVFCTEDAEWHKQVERAIPDGATAAVDAVGGKLAGQLLKTLKPLSTLLVYGALSMEPLQVPGGQLIFKSTTVKGFWLTDWKRHTPKLERERVLSELLSAMADGHIRPPVEAVYPLSRFREAIPHATRSGRRGKVLLRPGA
jgi:NADPH:quinone reductase-like Zn-dependent oxidoreductase